MRNRIALLALCALTAAFASGCANAEKKLGRGISNTGEILRMGEWQRSVEQTALFDSPQAGYTVGFVKGFNRTLARTGIGVYEIVTAPFPPYGPVATDYLSPTPVYPDSYKPGLLEDATFSTDTNLGFSGGDVMPIMGSRFRIFDTH